MRKTVIASAIFFLFFTYGLVLSQNQTTVIPEALEPKNAEGFYDYKGAANVHTDRGLGNGTPLDVIKAAQEVGLDFVVVTDLNPFEKPALPEGYNRKLLVIGANQYSYVDSRVILYDLQRRHSLEGLGQTQTLLADLLSQSGAEEKRDLIVLAHPTKPGFGWSGAYPTGLDGIEVINLKSVWRDAWENSKASFFWSLIVYPFNSALALIRLYEEPEEELALWDQLSANRHTIGMAGAEATARSTPVGIGSVGFPSYQTSFSLVSNHVLLRSEITGEAEGDRRKILSALADGNFYMSLDLLGDPKGFVAYVKDGEKTHLMGSTVKYQPGMRLIVKLPSMPRTPFEAAFLKDGQHFMSSNSVESDLELHGPGVYRVIVRVFTNFTLPDGNRWITWIYSNPFYVQ